MKKTLSVIILSIMLIFCSFFVFACTPDKGTTDNSENGGNGGENPPTHTHEYVIKFDATHHWEECLCGDKQSKTSHIGGTSTCTKKATCEVCNQSYGDFLPHAFSLQITTNEFKASEATCTTSATYYFSCVCGEKTQLTFPVGDPLGHAYTNYVSNNDATCEENGTETARCDHSGCQSTDEREDLNSALGHEWGEWTSQGNDTHIRVCVNDNNHFENKNCSGGNATCTEKATCQTCNTEYGGTLGHNFGAWISNGNNEHVRTCLNDSRHTETQNCAGGEATCEEKATCTICNSKYGNALGHEYGEWVTNFNGQHVKTCANNTTHTIVENCSGGTATCTERATCSTCHVKYGDSLGHDWGEWTSNGDSAHVRTCSRDNSHTERLYCSGGAPTCTERATCSTCNSKYGNELGHSYGEWISNGNGEHTRTCSRNCGHTETENCSGGTATCTEQAICEYCNTQYGNELGHNYGAWISNGNNQHERTCLNDSSHKETENCSGGIATCTEKATCEYCNTKYGNYGAHNYNEGVCTLCNTKKPSEGLSFELKLNYNDRYIVKNIGTCTDADIVIPSVYNNCPVVGIGSNAFYNCTLIKSIEMPDSILEIGWDAFEGCSSLKNVRLSNNITSLNSEIFSKCVSLSNIIIPNSVTNIGDSAFRGCSSLTSVEIPMPVTNIGEYVFSGCSSLTNITIFGKILTISPFTFYNCKMLTSVEIPNGVISVGEYAFAYCEMLRGVKIPNSVISIGNDAFRGCNSLSSIEIPSSINSISYGAFGGCNSLTKANYLGTIEEWVQIDFGGSDANPTCYAKDLHIDNDLVTEVLLKTVEKINSYAFFNCNSITKIKIPNSVLSIGNGSFRGCSSLNNVIFEVNSMISSIGYDAFCLCTSLSRIEIPSSVTRIGDNAFGGCELLEYKEYGNCLYLGNSENEYAFLIEAKLTIDEYQIHANTKVIADAAFHDRDWQTSIVIPDGVISIGSNSFTDCDSLSSIVISSSVTMIGINAFYYCDSLTIYCELTEKPSGWDAGWNSSNCPVVWGYSEKN